MDILGLMRDCSNLCGLDPLSPYPRSKGPLHVFFNVVTHISTMLLVDAEIEVLVPIYKYQVLKKQYPKLLYKMKSHALKIPTQKMRRAL